MVSEVTVDGIAIKYFSDSEIYFDNEVTTYAEIKRTYDNVTATEIPEGIAAVGIIPLKQTFTGQTIITIRAAVGKLRMDAMLKYVPYGMGFHAETEDPNIIPIGSDDGSDINCIRCKEDLDYDDLSTLEALISLFDVPAKILLEIAALKEEALLSQCRTLQDEINFMKADDVSCSLKDCNCTTTKGSE